MITINGTDVTETTADRVLQLATVASATPLTDGTIFTWTGSIEILHIIGRVTDAHPAAANNCKLTVTPDALAAYDICANKDLTGLGVGTLLSITGTAANAMVATTVVGSLAPGQANPVVVTCVTSGVISTVFSDTGNQAAAIDWELAWRPLSDGATVT
jgi:molybdopterin/thiamine biosynthesis adenylyltransferase